MRIVILLLIGSVVATFAAVGDIHFSRLGGTFTSPFVLQLTNDDYSASIRFTQDGSQPTESSPAYTDPLIISSSVQIRAASFAPGIPPGPTHSESYIQLDPDGLNRSSDLPAIIIYTFGGGAIPAGENQFANISIYEPTNGTVSLDQASTLSARAGIHLHGSTTLTLAKSSFSVGFRDDSDKNLDCSPLGLPADSDWILYAPNNFDPVLIHNPLAYQLSTEMGRYAPRTRFVEVYLNTNGSPVSASDYNGIYVLEEKIKWGKARVDIHKLQPENTNSTSVTGGYLMKLDRLGPGETGFTSAGQTIVYVNPSESDMNTPERAPQKQYIQDYMDDFGRALYGNNYQDPTNGFRAFVDVDSWIDYHILNLVTWNVDALRLSAFFYKDRNDKLFFGPVWDFDRSQGSSDGRDFNPQAWHWQDTVDYFNTGWMGRMFTDLEFWQRWIDRYQNFRTGALSTNSIHADVDLLTDIVRREQPLEVVRWPDLTLPRIGLNCSSNYCNEFSGTYQGEVDFLKAWYDQRLEFIDKILVQKPVYNSDGGVVSPGVVFNMTGPAGATLYYTINGTDPRLPGGALSPDARVFSGPISLASTVTIFARAFDANHQNPTGDGTPPLSSSWSGLTSASFTVVPSPEFTQTPVSLEAYEGQSPVFTVRAIGNPAPVHQWQFNGNDLPSQTNSQLILTNVQLNQSGTYSVTASNSSGIATSTFTVIVTTKPNLLITEVMASEAKNAQGSTLDHQDWWELSNLGNFAVNLRGYRFDDASASLSSAYTITNDLILQPDESVIMVENMSADAFRTWWGPAQLPADVKIITYSGNGLGLDSGTDAINVWNAAATTDSDKVTSVSFVTATRGISFAYDFTTGVFGTLSQPGYSGAIVAAVNGDIGSPGTIDNLPHFTQISQAGSEINLTLSTRPQRTYLIQYKNSITDKEWQSFTVVTATTTSARITDRLDTANPGRFYRALVFPY